MVSSWAQIKMIFVCSVVLSILGEKLTKDSTWLHSYSSTEICSHSGKHRYT